MSVVYRSQNRQNRSGAAAVIKGANYFEEEALSSNQRSLNAWMKRALDLLLSVTALIVLGLPMLAVAVLIRLDSPGPAVFKQKRIGRAGRPFVFYKFRSMRLNNDDSGHRSYIKKLITSDKGYGYGNQFKITDDSRVTRIGRFLRLSSIDELMQLFNVIKGEMSLVGPRPPLPYEVELYNEEQRRRLLVKPGITGLWQVSGRTKVGFQEMIDLDLAYINKRSVRLDLAIIARTIPALIRTRGW